VTKVTKVIRVMLVSPGPQARLVLLVPRVIQGFLDRWVKRAKKGIRATKAMPPHRDPKG
jgi:hypothetical protein